MNASASEPSSQPTSAIDHWVAAARDKLAAGTLSSNDLDDLAALTKQPRQRILYIHAATPAIDSHILTLNEWGLSADRRPTLETEPPEWPYRCVHDAVLDGWQIIHFPNQLAPFDDREIDILGYEFILQKLEYSHE